MTGRRQFLASLGMFGVGLLYFKNASAFQKSVNQTIDYIPHIHAVVEKYYLNLGMEFTSDRKECLSYACKNIVPRTHAELAATIALGDNVFFGCNDSIEFREENLDEYVRRKNGMPPMFADHPLLDLPNYEMPMTYRVPIYHEQLVSLIQELTGVSSSKSEELLEDYKCGRDTKNMPIKRIARTIYQESLTEEEFFTLEWILMSYAVYSQPYCMYSVLADQVESLAINRSATAPHC